MFELICGSITAFIVIMAAYPFVAALYESLFYER